MAAQSAEELRHENEELRLRLEEAEEALRALRAGEADAVVVTAGREQVYTLESPDEPYRLLVEQMPHAAATLTADGAILHGNRRFAELLGRPAPSLAGRSVYDFVAPEGREALAALLRGGQNGGAEGEVTLQRGDGTPAPAYLGARAVREGALGWCLLVTDRTEQRHYEELRRTQEALRDARERLELAQRAGRIGTFEWDVRTGAVSWSATEEELYGLPPGGFGGRYEAWTQAVHPDDHDRAEAAVRQAIAERAELDTEFRIVRPDGQTRWVAARGKVFCDDAGRPLRLVGVNLDVTERKRTEEALREADRRKDEFLATLAHELRNPLAPIRNAVQLLKAKGQPSPELDWARGVLDRQVRLMARLLEDLLDVSRIARNRLELRKERVELAAVADAALETSRPLFEAAGHRLTVTLPPAPVHLDADPVRLAQVLANLLNNAAKYTEPGGRAWLSAERRGGEVVVSVKDSGIGIPPEVLPHVFELFTQSERALALAQGGLGIGLSLAKGLVELHGGSIEARSDGPGKGSEFVVRLPAAAEAPAAPAGRPEGGGEQKPGPKYRVLIVDDNRDSADSLALLLKLSGHEVRTAYDGEQAVAAAEESRPDVVLLDIGMPKLNGYDACRRIRAREWGRGTVLVALTGWGQEGDRRRTEEAGFDRHMVKPVGPDELMQLLADLPAARRAGRPG